MNTIIKEIIKDYWMETIVITRLVHVFSLLSLSRSHPPAFHPHFRWRKEKHGLLVLLLLDSFSILKFLQFHLNRQLSEMLLVFFLFWSKFHQENKCEPRNWKVVWWWNSESTHPRLPIACRSLRLFKNLPLRFTNTHLILRR